MPQQDDRNESPLLAYLVLTKPATIIAVAVGVTLFVAVLVSLPQIGGTDESVRAKWVGLLCAVIGWGAGHLSDAIMGRGWWSTGARAARAQNPAWMGAAGARRRRLIVILIALTVVFATVLAAFSLAR
jgi:hypothetical protein